MTLSAKSLFAYVRCSLFFSYRRSEQCSIFASLTYMHYYSGTLGARMKLCRALSLAPSCPFVYVI